MSLTAIAHTLAHLGESRPFAARRTAPTDDLVVQVRGVGPLVFPLDPKTVRQLIAVAKPAPYGLRDKTLVDRKVRDAWQIEGSKLKFGRSAWGKQLQSALKAMQAELQLPASTSLSAELDKLLIYEPGQFFIQHQDSEKRDDMLGTLVIVLPSSYTGGAVVIEHQDKKITYRKNAREKNKLTLIAFYADCRHELKKIESGYRVALTYRLMLNGAVGTAALTSRSLQALEQQVSDHFNVAPSARFASDRPTPADRLVYLLDHEYTQRGLSFSRLKGKDIDRVNALVTIAQQLDYHVCLTLADVREVRDCWTHDDWNGRYGRGRHERFSDDEEADDEEIDPDDYEIGDLQDSEVELRHPINPAGRAVSGVVGHVGYDELCPSVVPKDIKPYRSEYEPYMGNYGNTLERWYHRAAVVVWPKDRDFTIRAKASKEWAFSEIAKLLRAKKLDRARVLAQQLVPLLPARVSRTEKKPWFDKALSVAVDISDVKLATAMLQPFNFHVLTASCGEHLRRFVEVYGHTACRSLFDFWESKQRVWSESPLVPELPALVKTLCKGDAGVERELARWLVQNQWRHVQQNLEVIEKDPSARSRKATLKLETPAIVAVLHASVIAETPAVSDDVLRSLKSAGEAYSTEMLIPLLTKIQRIEPLSSFHETLRRHCVEELKTKLARPARKKGDWSLQPQLHCQCALCKQLKTFLANPKEQRLLWPLAKERRSHIHGVIDSHELPVTHTTHRSGSPFTLVLTKTEALFTQEAAERKRWQQDLGKLTAAGRSVTKRGMRR